MHGALKLTEFAILALFILDTADLANSEDRDEMPPYGAFHQGLRCFPR